MNSKRLHFSIISFSVLGYFPLFEYWKSLQGIEVYLSGYVAKFTSFFSSKSFYSEPVFTSELVSVSEEVTVLSILFVLSVLPLFPLPLYYFKQKVFGGFRSNASVASAAIGISFALAFHTGKLVQNGL